MNVLETLLFYIVIGLGVAAAFALTERRTLGPARLLSLVGPVLFWPIYLPLLLSGPQKPAEEPAAAQVPRDELTAAIEQIERELDAALDGLDGWAEHVLNRNSGRLGELRSALVAQADRIREMDALLARNRASAEAEPDLVDLVADQSTIGDVVIGDPMTSDSDQRRRKSRQARLDNMQRLADIRRRARSDMLDTFAWIRELVSMIHLAKFTGAPASRAEELVAQIAAAVESISIVATNDHATPTKNPPKCFVPAPTKVFDSQPPFFPQPQGT